MRDKVSKTTATHVLSVCLGLGVERAIEVGWVSLEVSWAANWVLLIVGVDASSGEDSAVNLLLEAAIGQVDGTDYVASHSSLLVVLAPIDIGAASAASTVQDVGWLDLLELCNNSLAVLHADSGRGNLLALGLKESLEVTSNPALTSPDEIDLVSSWCHDVCSGVIWE